MFSNNNLYNSNNLLFLVQVQGTWIWCYDATWMQYFTNPVN